MRNKPDMGIPALALGLVLLLASPAGAFAERPGADRWRMEGMQMQPDEQRIRAAGLHLAQFARPGRGRHGPNLEGANGGEMRGAGKRPGDRLTPEERKRLRKEIGDQGRDIYGRRPPVPPAPPPPPQR